MLDSGNVGWLGFALEFQAEGGVRAGFPVARKGMVIGLLGGSFDPAHGGHAHITREALKRMGLDRVWWLVSPGNPLKAVGPAPLAQRMARARAVMRDPRVVVSDLEARLGTRFTAETLERLRAIYPGVRFVWLMGADNLVQLHQWKDWRGLARSLPIAVFTRPHYIGPSLMAPTMAFLRRFRKTPGAAKQWNQWSRPALLLIAMAPDPRSATAVRAAHPDWAQKWL